jgi:N-acetylmuramoyl-L-alanine amidase CwlA
MPGEGNDAELLAQIQYDRAYGKRSSASASWTYQVDDQGIFQSYADTVYAWHAGGDYGKWLPYRNSNSIGIEMCCTAGNYKVSAKTIKNTAYLTANLCKRLGIKSSEVDKHVLRHYDITHKTCPAQMVDNSPTEDKDWVAFKDQVKKILKASEAPKTTKPTYKTVNYVVQVTVNSLNIRKGPGTEYKILDQIKNKGSYTIVKETKVGSNTWGLLKAGPVPGSSWICLTGYTKKVK